MTDSVCDMWHCDTNSFIRVHNPSPLAGKFGWLALPKSVRPLCWASDILTELAVRWRAGSIGSADRDPTVGSSHAAALSRERVSLGRCMGMQGAASLLTCCCEARGCVQLLRCVQSDMHMSLPASMEGHSLSGSVWDCLLIRL